MKIRLVISSGIFLFFIGGCTVISFQTARSEELTQKEKKFNIILITISSLRADHVSCLGYDRRTTPNFDEFAKNNILFSNAFATSSWQMPAIGSIFTSLYPTEHGATHVNKILDPKVQTLAGILKEKGFYTAGFSCNPRLTGEYGFDRGFDYYDDYSVLMMYSTLLFDQKDLFDINKKRTNDLINDAAMRWLANNASRPFFLFVHYYDNHWDYLPPKPNDSIYDPNYHGDIDGAEIAREPLYSNRPSDEDVTHIIALYDGEIRQTDYDLGEMLTLLKKQGRFEDTLIIVMSDHGQQFYEHGHTSHHGIYDELIRVPLAISVPNVNEHKLINSLASGVDIMPTIFDYTGLPIPVQCRGQSFRSLIENDSPNKRDYVFVEYTGGAVPDCFAIRYQNYKFVSEKDNIFAYNLADDPSEQRKIYRDKFNAPMNEMYDKAKTLLVQEKTQAK